MYEFLPPVQTCLQIHCLNNPQVRPNRPVPELRERRTSWGTLFTRSHGAIPISTIFTYCRGTYIYRLPALPVTDKG